MDNFIFNMFGMLVLFMFLVIIGGGISQWVKNNNSPRETVKARVVDKKSEVTYIQQEQNGMMTNTPQWNWQIIWNHFQKTNKKESRSLWTIRIKMIRQTKKIIMKRTLIKQTLLLAMKNLIIINTNILVICAENQFHIVI